jgi:hypothetical protein
LTCFIIYYPIVYYLRSTDYILVVASLIPFLFVLHQLIWYRVGNKMNNNISEKFKKFLFLQEKAIVLLNQCKLEFKNSHSLNELDQALEILKPEYDLYLKKGEERFKRMLITQDKLKRPSFFSIYDENEERGLEVIRAILAIQNFFDNIRENKIPVSEKIILERDLKNFLSLYEDAIRITEKYIEKFKNNINYKETVSLLQYGLRYLQGSYTNIKNAGIVDLRRRNKIEKRKRPGLGLFGSFDSGYGSRLRLIKTPDGTWSDEIVDSLKAIELFFVNM